MAKKETDHQRVRRRTSKLVQAFGLNNVLSVREQMLFDDLIVNLIREERSKCKKIRADVVSSIMIGHLKQMNRMNDQLDDANNKLDSANDKLEDMTNAYNRFDMSKYKEGSRHGYSEND